MRVKPENRITLAVCPTEENCPPLSTALGLCNTLLDNIQIVYGTHQDFGHIPLRNMRKSNVLVEFPFLEGQKAQNLVNNVDGPTLSRCIMRQSQSSRQPCLLFNKFKRLCTENQIITVWSWRTAKSDEMSRTL